MSNIILSTNKLCKTYSNDGVLQHIIKNLDLNIIEGDFTVIMGPSGAGKSTLLYGLSGMDKPTLGEIYFDGNEISKYSDDSLSKFRRDNCGFVFQQIYLLDNMSVMDNVMACGLLVHKSRIKVLEQAKLLFHQVNIPENIWLKFPSQISGGEAQRVGIVRALINNPKILFADEPTGALNSTNSSAVLDILSEVNDRGQSIIMVTHDLKSARRGNRILYLKDGAICGECILGKYSSNDESRHDKLTSFLSEMGW